ncbi:helix-turn-helix domain-containing protein [Latilactobacillus curvatus]|nr:helix-turn-helix domain-containing protein [Latilactobacillus curvatus]MCP8847379.1 helix-turn-helix domain-containing protein [Latilactobacillus curvatus]
MSPYKHLTMSERETIFLMHNNQASLTSIAQTIGRATATVSRELSRK